MNRIVLCCLILFVSPLFLTGCSSSNDDSSTYYSERDKGCIEPENPYFGDGGGHDKGWQRGEEGNDCGGNSSSFIQGCDEYYAELEEYETCLDN